MLYLALSLLESLNFPPLETLLQYYTGGLSFPTTTGIQVQWEAILTGL